MENIKIGYVYIMSNISMPDIYKIGFTTQDINYRLKQLSKSTSIPSNFKVVAYGVFDNCCSAEKHFHKKFAKNNVGKEFFKFNPHELIFKVCNTFHAKKLKCKRAICGNDYDRLSLLAGVKNEMV